MKTLMTGRKRTVRDARYAIIKDIAQQSIDRLGFFTIRWNLRFILDRDLVRDRPTVAYFKQLGVYRRVPKKLRLSRRTIERYAEEIAEDLGLQRFMLSVIMPQTRTGIRVYGDHPGCLGMAQDFLSGLPKEKIICILDWLDFEEHCS